MVSHHRGLRALLLLTSVSSRCVEAYIGWGVRGDAALARRSTPHASSLPGAEAWIFERFGEANVVEDETESIVGAISAAWNAIASVIAEPAISQVVLLPNCAALEDVSILQKVYNHLEQCQDCCESFGFAVSLTPHPATSSSPAAFEVRRTSAVAEEEFGDDPFWDGGWDIDRSSLESVEEDPKFSQITRVPELEKEIVEVTRAWNEAIITGMGICPFSLSADKAGLPIGKVRYSLSRATTAEEVYKDYWAEVIALMNASEREISTTLLITPYFGLENMEAFDMLSQVISEPLELLGLEEHIQLVFFHPQHTFRDGQARLGSAGAANYARRSPFPMINILRTPQVRLAQKSIPTGYVYQQNEEVLAEIGTDALQQMLENRDWSALSGKKVDRKKGNVEYYRTAEKLQQRMEQEKRSEGEKATVEAKPKAPRAETEMPKKSSYAERMKAAVQSKADKVAVPPRDKKLVDIHSRMPAAAAVYSESVPKKGVEEPPEKSSLNESIKRVASILMKRFMTKRPLSHSDLSELDSGIRQLLSSTDEE